MIVTVPAMRGASARPAHLQRGIDVDPPELVAHHLEAARRRFDLEVADAQLVRAQAAVDVEALAVHILEVQRRHGDLVMRERQRGAHVLVLGAARDDEERGVGDLDRAVHVRIAAGADRLDVDAQIAGDVADDAGDAFDQAEADGARLDGDVDRLFRQRGVEQPQRRLADRGDPDARRLIEPEVHVEHLAGVLEAAGELLIADPLDAPVDHRHRAGHLRVGARAAQRRVEIEHAGVPRGAVEGRLQRVQEDVRRLEVERAGAVLPPRAVDGNPLIAVVVRELCRRDRRSPDRSTRRSAAWPASRAATARARG